MLLKKNFNIAYYNYCWNFGLFHGVAHGVEMPKAANPLLFVLGFVSGTITLHLFGVGIGYYSIKTKPTSILLRLCGIVFAS